MSSYDTGAAANEKRRRSTQDLASWKHYTRIITRPKKLDRRLEAAESLYVGAPGTGKTSHAYTDDPWLFRLSPPSSVGGPVWWDGYSGQRTILIDDFDGWIPYRTFLQVTDVYPLTLPVKGGFVYADYSLIIITSNFPHDQWFVGTDPTPITRRIHEIINL